MQSASCLTTTTTTTTTRDMVVKADDKTATFRYQKMTSIGVFVYYYRNTLRRI